ncbi:LOW QUALITY PROTEIN: hypothetical protein V2J09_014727, partial [Rumex salicifolius]
EQICNLNHRRFLLELYTISSIYYYLKFPLLKTKMDFLIYPLCILFSFVLVHHLLSRSRKPNLPPGPTPLPIVGNLFKLGNKPHESLAELAKIHGPVMSLKLGGLTTIVISSSSVAKEVLQKNDALFCNRNIPDSLTACQHHEFSVVFLPLNGGVLGRYATLMLESSQFLRSKKLEDLLSYVRRSCCSQSGVAIDIGKAAFNTTLNLLSNTFFSVDLVDPNSSNSHEFKELVWQIMVEAGKPNLSDYFPVLKKLDPQGIRRRLETHFGKMINLFKDMTRQRLAERKGCLDESNDTLDTLLKISQENSEELDLLTIPHLLQTWKLVDSLSYFSCILFSCSVLHYLLSHTTKSAKKRLPPGPIPLPIVGNLFKLGNRPHESMAELAKIHGPWSPLLPWRKEVLQRNDALFCNRAVPHSLTALQHHDFSIVFLPASPQWRSYRKIFNSNIGFNCKPKSQEKVLEDLLEYLKSCSLNRVSVDIGQAAFSTTLNLLSNTFFSVDLVDLKSTNSHEFKELVWQIMVEAGTPNLSDYFTLLRRFESLRGFGVEWHSILRR